MVTKRQNRLGVQQEPRLERKFLSAGLSGTQIEALVRLHPALFVQSYESRWINNVYFDYVSLKHYHDSVDGSRHRRKVRIRWYGQLFGIIENAMLELKIKEGLVGEKIRYSLPPFRFGVGDGQEALAAAMRATLASEAMLCVTCMEIVLANRYRRQYFVSASGKVRLTLDSEIESYRWTKDSLGPRHVDDMTTVLELKYDECDEDYASWVSNYFPLRLTRNSKYVNGIERLGL